MADDQTFRLILAVAMAVFVPVALYHRIRSEEAKLVERFGDDYRRYMARTGRFFPRLRSPSTAA